MAETQPDAMLTRAISLHENGELNDASALYVQILSAQPKNTDALHLLGLIRQQSGQFDEARNLLQKAVSLDPTVTTFRTNFATALLEQQRFEDAIEEYRYVLKDEPDKFQARFSLATAEHELGKYDEAIANYRIVVEAEPLFVEAHNNLGFALMEQGQFDDAIAAYRQATVLGPDYEKAHSSLLSALVERASQIDGVEGFKRVDPEVLAFRALQLSEQGDEAGVENLLDYDRLIHEVQNNAPTGYNSLADFHAELTEHLLNLESLKESPDNHATRNGKHSGEILVEPKGPVAHVEAMMESAIRYYKLTHPIDADHPYLAHQPDNWRLAAWTVIMRPQGHQIAHLHPEGWISGVYYVELPPVVAENKDQAGWIEFGRPPTDIPLKNEVPTVRVQPQEGLMVLFPSYFYHQTIPYGSVNTLPLANPLPERRICIAFDVIPVWD
jgi:tetratricopeptide (TPR) repeat protein